MGANISGPGAMHSSTAMHSASRAGTSSRSASLRRGAAGGKLGIRALSPGQGQALRCLSWRQVPSSSSKAIVGGSSLTE